PQPCPPHLPPLPTLPLFPPTNPPPSPTPRISKPAQGDIQLLYYPPPSTLIPVMEKLVSLAEPVGFLFLQTLISYVIMTLLKSSPTSLSFLRSCVEFCTCLSMTHDEPPAKNTRSRPRCDAQLGREDVEMVMDVMGLRCSSDGEPLREVSSDELSSLFEEKEPSLEEVKETFRVFDQNGDGFIDALELQRVLTGLGFVEGSETDACGRMIELYDENHDGKIDFVEFVRLMEMSFC
ncbi:hypothetical protein B296_00040689, partial [Ensete ventricosum]